MEMGENLHDAEEFHPERLMMQGEALPEPSMGPDDVPATAIAEWLAVRLWPGADLRSPLEICRPCPGR